MNLKELELLFEESGCQCLSFRMIDELNRKKGKPPLTGRQKLNLCAQEKYHERIIRTYLYEGKAWCSGFKWLKEPKVKVDNSY